MFYIAYRNCYIKKNNIYILAALGIKKRISLKQTIQQREQ